MSFDLRVFIGGVCAFVPEKPVRPNEKNRLRVLLVDTRSGQLNGQALHRHSAEIHFDLKDVVTSDATPAFVAAGRHGVWTLDKDDLSIADGERPADESGLVIASGQRAIDPATGKPANPRPIAPHDSPRDYSWLADMRRITGGMAASVKPQCFDDPAELLEARLDLDYGTLSVATVWNQGPTEQLWSFADGNGAPGSDYRQAVATWLEATIKVFGDHVDVVATNFPGQPGKRRVLRLAPANGTDVEIDLTLFSGVKKLAGFQTDESFRWIYRLLADFNGPLRVPTRSGAAINANMPLDSLTTFCPGGGFDPYP